MKVIRTVDERYYPDEKELKEIKDLKHISLLEIAEGLDISYQHLWRKLTRHNYPRNAFSRLEVERLQVLTGIKFNLH